MVPKLQALQRPISATNWQNVTSINHESEVWAALNLKWRNPKPFLGTPCSVGTNALSQRRVITTGAGFSKTGTPTVHFVLFAANKAARGQCGLNQVKYPWEALRPGWESATFSDALLLGCGLDQELRTA